MATSPPSLPPGPQPGPQVIPQPGPRVTVGQHSTAGVKARNDDSYGVLVPEPPLLAVKGIAMAIADGMSSSEAAKEASENAVKSFLEDYFATAESWSVKKSVGVVLKAVNSWLYGQGQRRGSDRGMVTTFSGLVLKAGTAHIFHAGDSRIARIRDGRLEPLTRDHRVQVSKGHEHLSRAFGIDQNIEVDYRAEPLDVGDVLLFTTDGVHDHVAPAEIIAALASTTDLDTAALALVNLALEHGSTDNLTCQIVRIDDPGRVDEAGHLRSLTALPFPPELAPGKVFDGFTVTRELHASKRTQVYLARDSISAEMVVLKTPSVNFEDNPAYIEAFSREEWVGKLVASPHVLRVLPATRARRHLYYVTEYFDGQTLRQWMRDHPTPDLETVRGIVDQIAKGLRAFHRKEIIHQDLKPENIMIDTAGLVKIIDFGSSRAAGFDEMASAGIDATFAGTVDYTAPEHQRGERSTNRADIYALGCIAYEMLTGKLPYGRGFTKPRDLQHLMYVSARAHRDDIPDWMDAALEQAVNKSPVLRTDLLSALVENLRQPNPALVDNRARPLLQRNPTAFWRTAALILLAINLALIVKLIS
jgi:eukaryotic-like serine/threonine-protein kinase